MPHHVVLGMSWLMVLGNLHQPSMVCEGLFVDIIPPVLTMIAGILQGVMSMGRAMSVIVRNLANSSDHM